MIDDSKPPETQIDLTGQTVGDYAILRRLGRGGMADVYLARQKSLDRNVALKVLKPDLARDASYIERFQREAQSAARLVQANIVGVYEVGQLDGLHYIAQEYVVGRNLREYLARNSAVKPVMAINVLRQVALALQKAAQHNVTHRDIKPENIMLSPGGEVKVADFGLARVDDPDTKHLTQIGVTMGTPLYMSPEQVEGHSVDVRSDIYSLGVTAYHMLAGHPPFDGDNALSIAVQHVKNQAQPLDEIRPDVPAELIELINKMMAKSPEHRPQDPGQLLKSIKAIKVDQHQDWEQLVETLAVESTSTPTAVSDNPRLEATRQLQDFMKGNVKSWWTELSTLLGFAVLLFTGLFTGFWFANQSPPVDPLSIPYVAPGAIPKMETAKLQYEHAVNFHPGDLQYYQAVLNYFPLDEDSDSFFQTRLYRDKARERQAEIHLQNSDYDKAAEIYGDFADYDYQQRPRLVVVGQAGMAIVLHYQNDSEAARSKIIQVEPQVDKHLNQFLLKQFREIRSSYFDAGTISST